MVGLEENHAFTFEYLQEECNNQCRLSILMQYILAYPESLAMINMDGHIPLHLLLWNDSSSMDVALMMIEEYPGALYHRNSKNERLPLHIECHHQCRPIIIAKCIELYPESLAVIDMNDSYPCIGCCGIDQQRQIKCSS
jgi:hypothetical protein